MAPKAEFKEFELRFKFKPQLNYGWFHIKLYQMFQDLSRRLIQTGFWADLSRDLNSLNSGYQLIILNCSSKGFYYGTKLIQKNLFKFKVEKLQIFQD